MTRPQHRAAERDAHLDYRPRDVDLVLVQVARQAFEVAQHLEARDAQSAGLDFLHRGLPAGGMADEISRSQHHLAEAGLADGAQLGGQRPGE
jgi:hypothetical protein